MRITPTSMPAPTPAAPPPAPAPATAVTNVRLVAWTLICRDVSAVGAATYARLFCSSVSTVTDPATPTEPAPWPAIAMFTPDTSAAAVTDTPWTLSPVKVV